MYKNKNNLGNELSYIEIRKKGIINNIKKKVFFFVILEDRGKEMHLLGMR